VHEASLDHAAYGDLIAPILALATLGVLDKRVDRDGGPAAGVEEPPFSESPAGRSGDTTPGTRNASPTKRVPCRSRMGRNPARPGWIRNAGQKKYVAARPHVRKLSTIERPKRSCGSI
jgi:hypothetical protein